MPTYMLNTGSLRLDYVNSYIHPRQAENDTFILVQWSVIEQCIVIHTHESIAKNLPVYIKDLEHAYYDAIDFYDRLALLNNNPFKIQRLSDISAEILEEVIIITDG